MSNAFSEVPAQGFYIENNTGSHNPTLTSTFSYLLCEAEKMFGVRDKSFTFVGLEYLANGQPCITSTSHDGKHLAINLTSRASKNINAALSEMSHEVFHILGPIFGVDAPVIEEGCAAFFARKMCQEFNWMDHSDENYLAAIRLVEPLLKNYPNAIKELRAQRGGQLFGVTSSEILAVAPLLTEDAAMILAGSFPKFCEERKKKNIPEKGSQKGVPHSSGK